MGTGIVTRLWAHLVAEIEVPSTDVGIDREQALRRFVSTPCHVERVLMSGTLVCLDSFLHVMTILPLRFILALCCFLTPRSWKPSQWSDIARGLLMILSMGCLLHVNLSQVYYALRGQGGITLYALFSIFEVVDKVCCVFGQDILECLVSVSYDSSVLKVSIYGLVAFAYCVFHSFILLWQLATLNLTVNSGSNSMLSLLLTSQVGEIKSAVFKTFDAEKLFQLTCEDITQRFQMIIMVFMIMSRSIVESSCCTSNIFRAALFLLVSTTLVDYLKHAYITNFNGHSPEMLYTKFLKIIMSDFHTHKQLSSRHLMMRRSSLPVLPLVVVSVCVLVKNPSISYSRLFTLWFTLLFAKLLLGVYLFDYSTQRVKQLGVIRREDSFAYPSSPKKTLIFQFD